MYGLCGGSMLSSGIFSNHAPSPAELLPELEIVNCAQEGASCASQQLIGSTGVSSCIYGI